MSRSVLVVSSLAFALLAPFAGATDRDVDISGNAFEPALLRAEAGDVVSWTNQDTIEHTVSCDNGCPYFSGVLEHLATFTTTLEDAGTQTYTCDFHPGMHGTLYVGSTLAADPDLAPVAGTLTTSRGTFVTIGSVAIPNPLAVAFHVDVKNFGSAASAATSVDFVVPDATGAPQVVASANVPALAAGATASVTGEWSPSPLTGDATVSVVVDPANDVVESVESNDVSTSSVHVGLI